MRQGSNAQAAALTKLQIDLAFWWCAPPLAFVPISPPPPLVQSQTRSQKLLGQLLDAEDQAATKLANAAQKNAKGEVPRQRDGTLITHPPAQH